MFNVHIFLFIYSFLMFMLYYIYFCFSNYAFFPFPAFNKIIFDKYMIYIFFVNSFNSYFSKEVWMRNFRVTKF